MFTMIRPSPSAPGRALLVAAATLFAAAGCDRMPFSSQPATPIEVDKSAALTVECEADVSSGRVECDGLKSRSGLSLALFGGQDLYVKLVSDSIEMIRTDAATPDTFAFDVTIQNLLNEAMGSVDGATAHASGIRLVFHRGPNVTGTSGGSGTAEVANADGTGIFTEPDQPFFRYQGATLGPDGFLTGRIDGGPGEVSDARRWKIALSDNVTTFSFSIIVDAVVQPLVRINEVMVNPSTSDDTNREYVELINRGTFPVNLGGWTLQDSTSTAPFVNRPVAIDSLVVAGGATALLGRSADPSLNGGIAPDFVYAVPDSVGIMALSNSGGDFVRLSSAAGAAVDSIRYVTIPTDSRSRERISFAAGSHNLNSDAHWQNGTHLYNGVDRGTPTPRSGVTPHAAEGISFSLSPDSVPVGYDKPIFITVRDSLGNVVSPFPTITWESLDPTIATVDERGYVTGLAVGTATIRATTSSGSSATVRFKSLVQTVPHGAVYRNHVAFGVPMDADDSDDYRLERDQFHFSYNQARRSPNWVSWNINKSHFEQGGANAVKRCDCFTDEPLVPEAARAYDTDYRNGGYDRGHMVQSETRTRTYQENATTFYLSNILPQAGDNNQQAWADLEVYLNDLARLQNKEIYVIAGGQYGAAPPTLKGEGRVAIPEYTWKVAVVVDSGETAADVATSADLTVIAVRMPNFTAANATDGSDPRLANPAALWTDYVTTVDDIEASTGYDLLTALGDAVEAEVEAAGGAGGAPVPTRLEITTQPSGTATSGVAFAQQPVVRVVDQNGNPFSAVKSITASLATGSGTLGGTMVLNTNGSGVATFTNLSITGTGSHTIRFAATGLVGDTSTAITVAEAVDDAPTVTGSSPANGATGVSINATIGVTFSEAVTTAAGAFTLSCDASAQTLVVSGSGSSRTLTPSAALPTSASCELTVVAANVTDLDGTADPMAANHVISFTTSASAVPTAVLRISEINPNISSSRDLIELVVLQAGTTSGLKLTQDRTTLLATLPDVEVQVGDVIVVHLTPIDTNGDAPASESSSKSQYPTATYAANYDNAWDFLGAAANITFSSRVIRVETSAGVTQDGVAGTTGTSPPASFAAALQAIQSEGHWLPVDCGGVACTSTTGMAIAATWSGTSSTRTGNSMRRVSGTDTNMKDDWAVGTNSFGVANP